MKTRCGVIAAVTAAAAIGGGSASLPAQEPGGQAPVFRSGVDLVTIDVNVVDRQGHPVRGLASGDFTVSVGGQVRRVVSAEYIDVVAARPQLASLSQSVTISSNEGAGLGRMFLFVVDQNTLEPGTIRHVARAASRFFDNLSFVDRSALVLMPAGPNVDFTWAHDKVEGALQRVIGHASPVSSWELGSLSEARDISNRNLTALRTVGQRECGSGFAGGGGGFDPFAGAGGLPPPSSGGPTSPTPGGGPASGGQGGGSGNSGGGSGQGNTGQGRSGGSSGGRNFGLDACSRDIQMRAEWTWRGAQMMTQASISSLRQVLSGLQQISGDKTVVLISGGWPLDEREQNSLLTALGDEAAAARTTIFTMFLPSSTSSASRRVASTTPANDHWLNAWPLESLAGMTGGASFRVDVGAEPAFDRLTRELSGYYRLGVEKDPADADGKSRRLKVQVARNAVTVRAREIFDARTLEDRNPTARLASALDSPIPATGIGLRVTSYVSADPDDRSRLKLVLAGEASRVDPGQAEFQLIVRDLDGNRILAGEKPLGEPTGDGLSFSANVPLPPGSYIVRVAVIDGTGRVGSVDHRADLKTVPLGSISATGPVLVRVPTTGKDTQARVAVSSVRQDERLALQVDLAGDGAQLNDAEVVFEIAAQADGPSLVQSVAHVSAGARGSAVAHAVADMRVLPPGEYFARARIRSASADVGEVRRPFTVTDALPTALADASVVEPLIPGRLASARPAARAAIAAPPFAIDQVMGAQVLPAFLERVAARPDASADSVKALLDKARSGGIGTLEVPEDVAEESAVAAFLRGLAFFANRKLELAAQSFRSAMRKSADFYPAMIYLGACYAAGGNDKEASGAWRTALIKEGDTMALHLLLADAQLRQNRGDLALQTIDDARSRWPADDGLKRRFVLAALLAGEYADGLMTLDELIERRADDEPTIAAGLLALYEAFMSGRPVEDPEKDKVRMLRLAEAYRGRGGPSLALVETWVNAALAKR